MIIITEGGRAPAIFTTEPDHPRAVSAAPATFQCPSDCGRCCTDLARPVGKAEARAEREWRALMRELGVYACRDSPHVGLSVLPDEAARLREAARERGLPEPPLHPRTFLLETRRRLAVVLDWHLAAASCPYYDDGCGVYEARPLVCRAYPVMRGAPHWSLAEACPLTEPTVEARATRGVRLGSFLRVENAARRALDAAHAQVEADAMTLLDAPGLRFAKGLSAAEAHARLRRYRVVNAAMLKLANVA